MVGNPEPAGISRRRFLGRFVGAVAAAVAAALAIPIIGYFLTPVFARRPPPTSIRIAAAADIPVGTPTFVTYQQTVTDGWVTRTTTQGAWVVTADGKNFTVFNEHCTHLGCLYAWNPGEKRFQCPCHGSIFDINGRVLAGPAPCPLDQVPFNIVDGNIEVTT